MNFYALPPILTSLLLFFIIVFVYASNPRSKLNIIFTFFCLSMLVWLFGFSMMYQDAANATVALKWARFGFLGILFVPIFAYHFIATFTDTVPKSWTLPLLYSFGFIMLFFSQTTLIYSGVHLYFWGFYPIAGPLYLLFLLMSTALFGYGVWRLYFYYQKLRREGDTQKTNQALYTLIAFAGATTGLVDYIIKYHMAIYPFGYLSALFFVVVITYAITIHRLLDVGLVIKRTAIYSLLTALLTGVFLTVILLSDYWLRSITGHGSLWVTVLAAFVVSLLFQPLRDLAHKLVDDTFFRARYNYQRILNKYSRALASPMTDLNRFSHIAPYLLWKSMKLSAVSVMVLDRQRGAYLVRAGEGKGKELVGQTVAEGSPLIEELTIRRREIDSEEIEFCLRNTSKLLIEERQRLDAILAEMQRLKSTLIIPCISESNYFSRPTLLSTLNLGDKASAEDFSRDDIEFLETMANHATISIEYAFIMEELKKSQAQMVRSEKLAALGTTAAGIAHELKNPLTYLSTVAQSMAASWDNPLFKETVIKMFPSEVERMKLIIDGLSDYSKDHELRIEPVEITALIEKVLAVLGYELRKNNVYVIRHYPPEQEGAAVALADKNRLVQVFMNILANAAQAIGTKGKGDLSIAVRHHENEVSIAITDNGPGIPADHLARIFDPFFTTKKQGTGLGLSITKRIIDEHQGKLAVTSRPGETIFTICLPRA